MRGITFPLGCGRRGDDVALERWQVTEFILEALRERKFVDMITKFLDDLDLLRVDDNVGVMSMYEKATGKGTSEDGGSAMRSASFSGTKGKAFFTSRHEKLTVLEEIPTFPDGWLQNVKFWPTRDAPSGKSAWSHLNCAVSEDVKGPHLKTRGYRFVSVLPGLNDPRLVSVLMSDDIPGEILDNPNMRSMVDSMENVNSIKVAGRGIDVMLIIYVSDPMKGRVHVICAM